MLRGIPQSLGDRNELTSVKRMMESARPVKKKKKEAGAPNFGGPRQQIEKTTARMQTGGPGSGPRGGKGGGRWKEGQTVFLKADKKEGWKRQKAKYDGPSGNGTHVVRVKPEDKHDDGIREVHHSQIE